MKLVAFTGKAGSGKDTAAAVFTARGWKQVRFADILKDMVCTMLGITREQLEDRDYKEAILPVIGKSPRYIMQTIGTDWGRNMVHRDLWTLLTRQRIEALLAAGHGVVMSDCRFDNEAELIRNMGGQVALIDRPEAEQVCAHASEAGIDPQLISLIIANHYPDARAFGAAVEYVFADLLE